MVNPYSIYKEVFVPRKKQISCLCPIPIIIETRGDVEKRMKEWARYVDVLMIDEKEDSCFEVSYRHRHLDCGDMHGGHVGIMEMDK